MYLAYINKQTVAAKFLRRSDALDSQIGTKLIMCCSTNKLCISRLRLLLNWMKFGKHKYIGNIFLHIHLFLTLEQ